MPVVKYKIIPYRDYDGFIISSHVPIWNPDKKAPKPSGGCRAANLIWCPEKEGLRYIGHCEACEFGKFAGHKQTVGVKCRTSKPLNAGHPWPDKTK